MKKLIALFAIAAVGALTLAGCNTIEGAGKDVKAAGGAVEKAAKSTKTY
jgi:predicted small secreted protein